MIIINNGQVLNQQIINSRKSQPRNFELRSRREIFSGDALEISDLRCADVTILPSSEDSITVDLSGQSDIVDQVLLHQAHGAVIIAGERNHGTTVVRGIGRNVQINNGGRSIQINSSIGSVNIGGTTIISDGDVIIDADDPRERIALRIAAPVRTEIDLSGLTASTIMSQLQGDARLNFSGQNSVRLACVHDLDLDFSGQCELVAEKITGDANLDLSGNGRVEILRGEIGKLSIDASGMCQVDIWATVKRAKLDASGMSRIRVKEIIGQYFQDNSGMSKILIG